MRVGGQRHVPAALHPGKRPGTHCIGGWVGPRAGLDECGKSRSTVIQSPDRPVRSVSLSRLSYPGPLGITQLTNNIHRTVIPFLLTIGHISLLYKHHRGSIHYAMEILFLWRFDLIPGHGLTFLCFLITLIGHATVDRTRLDG